MGPIQVFSAIGALLLIIAAFIGSAFNGTPFSSARALDLIWSGVTLCFLVYGVINIIERGKLEPSDYPFLVVAVLTIGLTIFAFAIDSFNLAALLAGITVVAFIASKVGILVWTGAILPALKAIPAALTGYYIKKWLDERGKKKTASEASLTEPPPATPPPPDPTPVRTPVKRKRQRNQPG